MNSTLTSRVAAKHLARTANDVDVMEFIVKQRDVLKLIDEMEDAGDKQSADLVRDVYMVIQKKLQLTTNEEYALKRLLGSVQRVGSWDAGTQRNNIFKAADLLGMKLPSFMFASEKK